MPAFRPPIPLSDYQRVFRVIKTVLDGAGANTPHACIFFSVAGAMILQHIYNKKCMPVAGAAFFATDGTKDAVLAFGSILDGQVSSTDESFHCWIQCDGYIVDFMAPIFRESFHSGGFPINCSRKMFQKPVESMLPDHTYLSNPGDFYLEPNVSLTRELLQRFSSRNDNRDLVNICLHWYVKPPKAIPREFAMTSSDGGPVNMTLSPHTLVGAW
jgi:hypothetical protein